MDERINNFLTAERLGVLAVELLDGSPHAATMHFAHIAEPFTILFVTSKSYRKAERILQSGETRASFVVGVSEQSLKTMQIDGIIRSITDEQTINSYLQKFPEKKEKIDNPEELLLALTPTWWKFEDYKAPEGQKTIESNN